MKLEAHPEPAFRYTEQLPSGVTVEALWSSPPHLAGPSQITFRSDEAGPLGIAIRSFKISDAIFAADNSYGPPQLERPGRAPRGDRYYADLAEQYLRQVEGGNPRPIRALAFITESSIDITRARVKEARKRGLLTSPGKGTSGGTLTAKAKRLLAVS